jgi:hypothetical protein
MSWSVNTSEMYGGANRALRINPYLPARVERLGNDTHQANSNDINKSVKLSGDTVVLCGNGEDIFGFVESVEVASQDGYSIAGVLCDPGHEAYAADSAGNLAVGNVVVSSGAAVAHKTPLTNGLQPVANKGAAALAGHAWMVMAVYGAGAGRKVLLRKVG